MTENCAMEDPQREDCMYDVLGVEGECYCQYECEREVRGLEVVRFDEEGE